MIDFVGRRNVVDEARNWGDFFGEQDRRGQQRWADTELRNRTNEANAYNRDEGNSASQFMSQYSHLFQDNPDWGDMAPRADTPIAPTAGISDESGGVATAPIRGRYANGAPPAPAANADLPEVNVSVDQLPENTSITSPIQPHPPLIPLNRMNSQQHNAYLAYLEMVSRYNTAQRLTRDHDARSFIPAINSARALAQRLGVIARTERRIDATGADAARIMERVRRANTPSTPAPAGIDTPNTGSMPSANAIASSGAIERAIPGATVNSAGRSTQRNAQVGGVSNSMHTSDMALDISVPVGTDLAQLRTRLQQIIGAPITEWLPNDRNASGDGGTHIHVGWRPNGGNTPNPTPNVGMADDTPSTSTATDEYAISGHDASRPMQSSRQLQLLQASVANFHRQAMLAAQHGRNDIAQQAFASALQGQAAIFQAEQSQLLHAAAIGNMRAAEQLIAEAHGYPASAVRIVPTDETRTRYRLMVQDAQGNFQPVSEIPMTRTELLSQLTDLADAQGAQARSEANQHMMEALIRSRTDLQVADINARARIFESLTTAQTARLTQQANIAIAQGRAQAVTNSQTGDVYIMYPTVDANGQATPAIERVWTEEQQGPSTDGHSGQRTRVSRRESVTAAPPTSAPVGGGRP